MGYQESFYYIRPQSQFDRMIRTCAQREKEGRYRCIDTYPCSVLTLKTPFGELPAGTRLLWVAGQRCFQRVAEPILGEHFNGIFHRCAVSIIPAERVLTTPMDARLEGIDLNGDVGENAYLKHQSFQGYAAKLSCRETTR